METSLIENFNSTKEEELLSFLTQKFGLEVFTPGLERTRPLYQSFINSFKERGIKIITIAGTNGKGQTAHTLGSFLNFEFKNFALWTSPHILSIRERFSFGINGLLSEATYLELGEVIFESEERLKIAHPDLKVSFYEFLFFAFLHLVQKKNIEYLILEVGLGGRLDAVNHFDANISCITSISRDHQRILGNRLDLILAEKIAVARKNAVLITNFHLSYFNERVKEYIEKTGVLWRPMNRKQEHYFEENQAMAWEIFSLLCPNKKIGFEESILRLPQYKGRREIMTFEGKSLIFIGAHNIDGVRRMLEGFEHSAVESSDDFPESLLVSFSQRPENEVLVMVKSLAEFFEGKSEIALTGFAHPKALSAEVIEGIAKKVNKGMLNFVSDWKTELKNTKGPTILICGSYYFIGEVQRFIRR
jgi:dihydrofolate synthase/folylpolyglutamate synthase